MTVEKCNRERLWNSIMEIGQIGHTEAVGSKVGGCHRLALTDKDKQARDLFVGWAKEIGCSLRVDSIGNLFLRREGINNNLHPVMTGSHLDTQPTGGKFDGIYGCLAGLEVLRCLEEKGIRTLRPIEVVVWTNEEGARFKPAMLGSGVYAKVFNLNEALATKDAQDISLGDELNRLGYQSMVSQDDPGCHQYYELHIEQGPVLEALDFDLGVVAGVLGMRWYDVEVIGRSCHAGPSPMDLRNDALVGVAEMITELTRIASSNSKDSRCTIGELNIPNSSTNVSPGKVTFSLDIREGTLKDLDTLQSMAFKAINSIALHHKLEVDINETWSLPPCPFDEKCLDNIEQACQMSYPKETPYRLISGAGHDAVYVSRVAPTAMIFVPSENGLSHNEREYTNPEQLEKGCDVLLNTIILSANSN